MIDRVYTFIVFKFTSHIVVATVFQMYITFIHIEYPHPNDAANKQTVISMVVNQLISS